MTALGRAAAGAATVTAGLVAGARPNSRQQGGGWPDLGAVNVPPVHFSGQRGDRPEVPTNARSTATGCKGGLSFLYAERNILGVGWQVSQSGIVEWDVYISEAKERYRRHGRSFTAAINTLKRRMLLSHTAMN